MASGLKVSKEDFDESANLIGDFNKKQVQKVPQICLKSKEYLYKLSRGRGLGPGPDPLDPLDPLDPKML